MKTINLKMDNIYKRGKTYISKDLDKSTLL